MSLKLFIADKCLGLVDHLGEFYPEAARSKGLLVVARLNELKLQVAALVQEHIEETFSYFAFPSEHWRSLRTNNPLQWIIREIRRRNRVAGAFPDGNSALLLISARLRQIAGKSRAPSATWTWAPSAIWPMPLALPKPPDSTH